MSDGDLRSTFVTLSQAMTTQAQAMAAQANREVGPRAQPNSSTTSSRLMDFMRMNPPMFYGSKVNGDPQNFINEVYKILYAMGLTSNVRPSYLSINTRMWLKYGTHTKEVIGY